MVVFSLSRFVPTDVIVEAMFGYYSRLCKLVPPQRTLKEKYVLLLPDM